MFTIHHTFHFVILIATVVVIQGQYEDARCKCVCQFGSTKNTTIPNRKVWIKTVAAEKCNCPSMLEGDSHFCPQCECKYQSRSTTIIKVVVCFIIGVIGCLTCYMLFLLLLEPVLAKRRGTLVPSSAMPGTNPGFSASFDDQTPLSPRRRASNSYRSDDSSVTSGPGGIAAESNPVSEVVTRARDQQKRWKGNVEAQRVRVYNEHSILN